jgi:hypothetical protein
VLVCSENYIKHNYCTVFLLHFSKGIVGERLHVCAALLLLLLLFWGFLGEEDHCARSDKDEVENRYYKSMP